MAQIVRIRPTSPGDRPALSALYRTAFPEEPLWPLVGDLIACADRVISLAACDETSVIGHIILTPCEKEAKARLALLGPLCVAPAHQRRGVGGALIEEGARLLAAQGFRWLYVLGDPAYYQRFGFAREDEVKTPYPLPAEWREAWRSRSRRPAP